MLSLSLRNEIWKVIPFTLFQKWKKKWFFVSLFLKRKKLKYPEIRRWNLQTKSTEFLRNETLASASTSASASLQLQRLTGSNPCCCNARGATPAHGLCWRCSIAHWGSTSGLFQYFIVMMIISWWWWCSRNLWLLLVHKCASQHKVWPNIKIGQ